MLLLTISNGAYILFSFVAFIVYAFIYLSSVGLLNGRKENTQNRPEVAGYESLRNGNQNIEEAERVAIERLTNSVDGSDESESSYDYEATFYGRRASHEPLEDSVATMLEDEANSQEEASPPTSSVDEEEGDEDDEWPTLKRPLEYRADDSTDDLTLSNDIVGDLTAEELVHLTNIRATTLNDAERYPELVEECMAANDKVNEFARQTGKSVEEIISTLLNSREKVIFNAFPMIQYDRAA